MRAPEPESKGADPVRVFMILAAILVAIGAFFWLTRSDSTPDTEAAPTSATESPDFSLTDAEAIARFKELDQLRLQALRERDLSLLPLAFTADGPARKRVQGSIAQLKSDNVLFRSDYETESLQVTTNKRDIIMLSQIVLVTPRFTDESGRDVTGESFVERQESEWTLRLAGPDWLIDDGTIVSAEKVRGE